MYIGAEIAQRLKLSKRTNKRRPAVRDLREGIEFSFTHARWEWSYIIDQQDLKRGGYELAKEIGKAFSAFRHLLASRPASSCVE
jgi:hypothetical protein